MFIGDIKNVKINILFKFYEICMKKWLFEKGFDDGNLFSFVEENKNYKIKDK